MKLKIIKLLAMAKLIAKFAVANLNINPFADEQLNLLGTVPKQVFHFSSLYIFFV